MTLLDNQIDDYFNVSTLQIVGEETSVPRGAGMASPGLHLALLLANLVPHT